MIPTARRRAGPRPTRWPPLPGAGGPRRDRRTGPPAPWSASADADRRDRPHAGAAPTDTTSTRTRSWSSCSGRRARRSCGWRASSSTTATPPRTSCRRRSSASAFGTPDPGPRQGRPYLRSIVLNLARDNNRRGLVSLRHHLPIDDAAPGRGRDHPPRRPAAGHRRVASTSRTASGLHRAALLRRARHRRHRVTLGISPNSVKTHLRRGLAALERHARRAGRGCSRDGGDDRSRLALHVGVAAVRREPRSLRAGPAQHRRRPPAASTRRALAIVACYRGHRRVRVRDTERRRRAAHGLVGARAPHHAC